jgi:NAD(P)-dependent dehydrogenase (short-subunit alcohol dehydrogenase family)
MELDEEVWTRVIDVNLVGPYLTCRAIVARSNPGETNAAPVLRSNLE